MSLVRMLPRANPVCAVSRAMSNLGDTDGIRGLQIAAGDGETPLRWCDLRVCQAREPARRIRLWRAETAEQRAVAG